MRIASTVLRNHYSAQQGKASGYVYYQAVAHTFYSPWTLMSSVCTSVTYEIVYSIVVVEGEMVICLSQISRSASMGQLTRSYLSDLGEKLSVAQVTLTHAGFEKVSLKVCPLVCCLPLTPPSPLYSNFKRVIYHEETCPSTSSSSLFSE
jgi:hypothetical protein